MTIASLKLYISGLLKRYWLLLLAILLDPFDLYNKLSIELLPVEFHGVLDMPSWMFPIALVILLFLAGYLTYRELYEKTVKLQAVLEQKNRRKTLAELLARLRFEGQELVLGWKLTSNHDEKKRKCDEWFVRCQSSIEEYIGYAEMDTFRSFNLPPSPYASSQSDLDRHFFNSKVEKLRLIVEDLNQKLR